MKYPWATRQSFPSTFAVCCFHTPSFVPQDWALLHPRPPGRCSAWPHRRCLWGWLPSGEEGRRLMAPWVLQAHGYVRAQPPAWLRWVSLFCKSKPSVTAKGHFWEVLGGFPAHRRKGWHTPAPAATSYSTVPARQLQSCSACGLSIRPAPSPCRSWGEDAEGSEGVEAPRLLSGGDARDAHWNAWLRLNLSQGCAVFAPSSKLKAESKLRGCGVVNGCLPLREV